MSKPAAKARPSRGRAEVQVGDFARYDVDRLPRTGVPEIVLGEGKTPDHLARLLWGLHRAGYGSIASRLTEAQRRRLRHERANGLPVRFRARGNLAWVSGNGTSISEHGVVAILTAGTADVPAAEEARGVLELCGVKVLRAYDVGVAGLHRLMRALAGLAPAHPEAYLVFAGREGALPTVVAGLVRGPVIGVPTSVGYGRGGRGEAALTAMLQSCAPIAVMNIDAAVPAALFALRVVAGSVSRSDVLPNSRKSSAGRGA